MKGKYDIIIIGAGPSGLNCAYHLAKKSDNILILEKNRIVGPKICAGGLTRKSMDYLKLPKNLYDNLCTCTILETVYCKRKIISKKPLVGMISRKGLGQWMLKRLKRFNNIKVLTNSKVTKITKTYVMVNNKKFKYKYLVGADGSNSLVRKYLGLESKNLSLAFHYLLKNKKFNHPEIFFDYKLFNSWYAWVFPHKDYISIGTGVDSKKKTCVEVRKTLEKWMGWKNIDFSQGKFEAFPVNCDYQGYKFGNIFLIGDAAGLVSHWTGEGIYQALISGQEVANIIINPAYKPHTMRKVIRYNKQHLILAKLSCKLGILMNIIYSFFLIMGLFLKKFQRFFIKDEKNKK